MSAFATIQTILENKGLHASIRLTQDENSITLHCTDQAALKESAQQINRVIGVTASHTSPLTGGTFIPVEIQDNRGDTAQESIFHRIWAIQIGKSSPVCASLDALTIESTPTPPPPLSEKESVLYLTKDGQTSPVTKTIRVDKDLGRLTLRGYGVMAGEISMYLSDEYLSTHFAQSALVTAFHSAQAAAIEPPPAITAAPIAESTCSGTSPMSSTTLQGIAASLDMNIPFQAHLPMAK